MSDVDLAIRHVRSLIARHPLPRAELHTALIKLDEQSRTVACPPRLFTAFSRDLLTIGSLLDDHLLYMRLLTSWARPPLIILALSASLSNTTNAVEAARVLAHLLDNHFIDRLLSDPADHNTPLMITTLASIPDRVANALSTSTIPLQLTTNAFIAHLISRIPHASSSSIITTVIAKLIRLGHHEHISRLLIQTMALRPSIWAALPTTDFDRIVEHAIMNAITIAAFDHLMPADLTTKPSTLHLITNSILLRKVMSKQAIFIVVSYLNQQPSRASTFLVAMTAIVTAWANSSFPARMSHPQQMSVSQAAIQVISMATSDELDGIMGEIMEGVQSRLRSPTKAVRRMGMRVAETMSIVISPNEPLQFGSVDADDDDDDGEQSTRVDDLDQCGRLGLDLLPVTVPCSAAVNLTSPSLSTPSAASSTPLPMHTNDAFWEDDTRLPDDDDLASIPIVGDEPIDEDGSVRAVKVRQPRFIRECHEYLGKRTDDARAYVELALATTESLVRMAPDDLAAIAPALSLRLLHLQDQWSTPAFSAMRLGTITALLAMSPEQVAPALTDAFFAQNYTIADRLDIVAVLGRAAHELASTRAMIKATAPATAKPFVPVEPVPITPGSVVARIESNTRRWSRPRPAADAGAVNRFAPLAPLFIYPLLRRIDAPDLNFDPFSADAILLAQLLHLGGVVVESAGNAPTTAPICAALFPLVWFARTHVTVSVRIASLFAISRVLLNLPAHIIADHVPIADLISWAAETAQRDPDGQVRQLAALCLHITPTR